ncbi:WYL domain-containing protein [Pseudomonas sp. IT-P258]|uniref:hypothetical protein n=1 Tax=Pseudomonas sp. IT-P258 TaxID=3026447 RepID=UPI0039E01D62
MAHEFDYIHTLEARSDSTLEILESVLQLDTEQMHRTIWGSYLALRAELDAKGIDYKDLKNALIPLTRKKIETAFLFDWTKFSSDFYGHEVMDMLLPKLDRGGARSLLYGDWIGATGSFARVYEKCYGETDLEARFPNAWLRDTVALYYVNNLTPTSKQALVQSFSNHPAYMGALDLTYTTLMKAMISTMLIRAFVQHKNIIIDTHDDGLGTHHNEGYLPWDFKAFGFTVKSIESSLYRMFLSYKIERPVLQHEHDVAMSLNSITPYPAHIKNCILDIDEKKLTYLRDQHAPALIHAGLAEITADELAIKVNKKLRAGYIYSMGRSKEDGTLKFNVVVEEVGRSRVLCGLKYFPSEARVTILTLF